MADSRFIKIYGLIGLVFAGIAGRPTQAQTQMYRIDSDSSEFRFTVTHLGMLDVHGSFQESSGFVSLDSSRNAPSRSEVVLQVASINTDDASRDENLRSEDFLDAAHYPVIRLKSISIRSLDESEAGPTKYLMDAELTIQTVTKRVQLPFRVKAADDRLDGGTSPTRNTPPTRLVITSEFTLRRSDYKLSFGRLMNAMVGDEIQIHVLIIAIAQT